MGCATKAGTGTAVGAGGGGVIGYALGGPTGLLIGAIAGGALGYAGPHYHGFEPKGADYRVVPTGTSYHKGRECRNFEMLAHVDSKPETVNGTACRRDDGSWESIST